MYYSFFFQYLDVTSRVLEFERFESVIRRNRTDEICHTFSWRRKSGYTNILLGITFL